LTVGEMLNNKTARSQSVSIAGDGIEIGRLQIHMDEKRTSHIKSQILEARLDEPSTEQTGLGKNDTKGWKILRESLRKSQVDIPVLDGAFSRHSMRGGNHQPTIRNSKLSLAGPRGSKLSLGGGPQGTKMRNSTCHIIQEEAEQSCANHDRSEEKREGWKVLRESIRQKQINQDLVLRKSTLKLHTMDECAVNRTSQVSFKRPSILSQLENQPTHPSIRTMYRRHSTVSQSSNDSGGNSKYGYSEMSVANHRRRSTISTAPTLNIDGITMSMEDIGADAQRLMRLSQKHAQGNSGCCPWMSNIRLKRVKSVH